MTTLRISLATILVCATLYSASDTPAKKPASKAAAPFQSKQGDSHATAVDLTVAKPPEAPQQAPILTKMYALFNRLRKSAHNKQEGVADPYFFQLTQDEINQYLLESQKLYPRPGLESVKAKFFPNNYVSTFTVLNFDEIEKWRPGTVPMLLRPILNGKKEIWVDVRFNAAQGRIDFNVEKAYFQSIRLPAILVQKVIEIVAARQPEHYDTAKPVPLPFGLQTIWTKQNIVGGQT